MSTRPFLAPGSRAIRRLFVHVTTCASAVLKHLSAESSGGEARTLPAPASVADSHITIYYEKSVCSLGIALFVLTGVTARRSCLHDPTSLYVSARVEARFRFSCREEDLRHADSQIIRRDGRP